MKHLLLLLIRAYRRMISPLTPRCCRYYPTCSAYAAKAIGRYGACKGSVLAFSRLMRCHPWARGGIDFVPQEFSWKKVPYYFRQESQNSAVPDMQK